MFSLALKNAVANRERFALTAFAVIISVAFLTATLILSDSMTGTAADDVAEANASIDLVVRGDLIVEDDGGPGELLGAQRVTLSDETVSVVESVDGVVDAEAVTTGFAKLALDGEPLGSGRLFDSGSAWISNEALNPFTLVDGSPPVGVGEVVIDRSTAIDENLVVGQTVQVLTSRGINDVEISGIANFGGSDRAPLQRTALFDEAVAAEILGETTQSLVVVEAADGVDLATVMSAVDAVVEVGTVLSGSEYIAAEQDTVTSPFTFLSVFLLTFAVVATLVGATLIYNTFSIAIAQRRREMALMRAVGAMRRDVLRTVMSEAALVAVVSTAMGIGVGLVGVDLLAALMSALGLDFLDGSRVVATSSIMIGAATGVVVTLLSAWFPARRAASAAPIEALRDSSTEEGGQSRVRSVVGLSSLAIGVAGFVVAALQGEAMPLIAAVMLVPGLTLAGPTIMSRSVVVLRPIARRLAGVEGQIATTNLDRNPRRASSTALALTLGVALVSFFTILGSSISASVSSNLDEALQADEVVTSLTPDFATIEPGLADRLAAVDGVERVAALRQVTAGVDGEAAKVAGVAVDDFAAVFDVGTLAGSFAAIGDGGIAVVASNVAEAPPVGDVVSIESATGVRQLEVVAVVENSTGGFDAPTHFVSPELLESIQPNLLDISLFVGLADGTNSDVTVDALRAEVSGSPGSLLVDRATYISDAGSEINLILNLVYAMLGLTVLIAVVGVANTTTLAISERTREIGLLRAIGTTVDGVRRVIQIEAMMMSLVGALVGVSVGVGGAWALLQAVGGENIPTTSVPWMLIAAAGVASAIAGLAAATVPAWSASRRPTLEALAS